MVYYNKNNKKEHNKYKLTKKHNPSELLNSKLHKSKKRLRLNIKSKSYYKKKTENTEKNEIKDTKLRKSANPIYNLEHHMQQGGYKQSKALQRILIKMYRTFNRLQGKYFPKMIIVKTKLYDIEQKKGISKVQRMVNHIIDIEERLHFLNNTTGTSADDMLKYDTSIEDLKGFKKWYGDKWYGKSGRWWRFDITMKGSTKKSEIEKRCRILQDYIRKKLMKEISFDKVKELNKCRKPYWKGGFMERHGKDTLICNINLYRKLEAKFNKYYQKFQTQYLNFIKTMGLTCDQMREYESKMLTTLNPVGSEITLPERFDYSLCNNYETIHLNVIKSFDDLSKKLSNDIDKKKAMNTNKLTEFQKTYNKDISKYINKAKKGSKTQDKLKASIDKNILINKISTDVKNGFDGVFTQFQDYVKSFNQLSDLEITAEFHETHLEALSTRSKLKKLKEMF